MIGVVLSPIPLADELALLPVYGLMTSRIGTHHGLERSEVPWRPIALTAFAGLAARAAINLTVSFIPGVAAVANAASAAALTELFGRYVDTACQNPADAHILTVREFAQRFRDMKQGASVKAA
ncbi:MAG: hypothetical protein ABIP39_16090 [Polyangiaceae bacterium]